MTYRAFRATALPVFAVLALSSRARVAAAAEPATPPPVTFPPAGGTGSAPTAPPESEDGTTAPGDAPEAAPSPPKKSGHGEATEPPEPPPGRPLLGGVGMGLGASFGGETLAAARFVDGSEQKLHAGQGLTLSARAFLTPLWVADTVGFGVGLEWGWKYTAITASNASISLRRFPFEATARALVKINPLFHLVFAGGVHFEHGVLFSASGPITGDAHIDNALGGTGEFGLLYVKNHIGWDVTARYTGLKYKGNSASAGASSGGIFAGIFYVF